MNKAFIFDMDGVLIDSESYWAQFEEEFLQKLFGNKIAKKIGHGPGRGVDKGYELAIALGATVDKDEFNRGFEEVAVRVYERAPLTAGIDELVNILTERQFKLGLVTQSRQSWIDHVMPLFPFKDKIEVIVTISDSPDLKPKPAPDGYLEAFRRLNAEPHQSVILEDSNPGIEAGKAAGAYTIGYRGNLVAEYVQTGADAYADTMTDVITLVERFIQR